jgi:hypothetical protein
MVITSTGMSLKDVAVAIAVSIIAPIIRYIDDTDTAFGLGSDE